MSAFNFFTGKPEIENLGYTFLFRNYQANTGKWQTIDPLGYPDGWNNLAYVNNGVTEAINWMGGYKIVESSKIFIDVKNANFGPDWKYSLQVEGKISSNGSVSFTGTYSFTRKGLIIDDDPYTGTVNLGSGNVSVDKDGNISFTPPVIISPSGSNAGVYFTDAQCSQHNMPDPVPSDKFHIATLNLGYLYFATTEALKATQVNFSANLSSGMPLPSGNAAFGIQWELGQDKMFSSGVWTLPVYIKE